MHNHETRTLPVVSSGEGQVGRQQRLAPAVAGLGSCIPSGENHPEHWHTLRRRSCHASR